MAGVVSEMLGGAPMELLPPLARRVKSAQLVLKWKGVLEETGSNNTQLVLWVYKNPE